MRGLTRALLGSEQAQLRLRSLIARLLEQQRRTELGRVLGVQVGRDVGELGLDLLGRAIDAARSA